MVNNYTMKKLLVFMFMVLILTFSLCVKNYKLEKLNDKIYNIKVAKTCCFDDSFSEIVGDYYITKLAKLTLNFNDINYIMFEMSKSDINILFDLYKIDIVKKYRVCDNIVYDAHSEYINISNSINIQIAVGDDAIKVGIPTIFNGF